LYRANRDTPRARRVHGHARILEPLRGFLGLILRFVSSTSRKPWKADLSRILTTISVEWKNRWNALFPLLSGYFSGLAFRARSGAERPPRAKGWRQAGSLLRVNSVRLAP